MIIKTFDKPPFTGKVKEYTIERYVGFSQNNISLDYKQIRKYDENGNLVEIHDYNKNNKLTSIDYYKYDNKFNLLEIAIRTTKGSIKQKLVYEYLNNKLFQITSSSRDQKTITKYDEQRNITESIFYRNISCSPHVELFKHKYDKNLLRETQEFSTSGEVESTVQYKYGKRNILVEKTETTNKKPMVVNGREYRSSKNCMTRYFYNGHDDVVLTELESAGFGNETHKREITYDDTGSIIEVKEFRKGYAYVFKDNFGLVSTTKYSYIR